MANYVLMNDTYDTWHHGCRAVSRVIRREMAKRGFNLVATSRVGNRWWEDFSFVEQIQKADLILINGEGSFHSGGEDAQRCIRVFHDFAHIKRIAIINSIWQDNPSEWTQSLKDASYVSLRDTISQSNLTSQGIDAQFCPDLSLVSSRPTTSIAKRSGVAWGDALRRQTTRALYDGFKSANGENYFASVRPRFRSPITPHPIKDFRYQMICSIKRYTCFNDEVELSAFLGSRELYITGRFHGACLSLCAGTPFISVASNTQKITYLLQDLGLNTERVFPDATQLIAASAENWGWSKQEQQNLEENLEKISRQSQKMFDEVCTC
ncbi:polysaccharide pyruvyl transferase family protein [Pseudovibrio ascidiaceicola]|uniref:polysaccharide pyruvyl transferase family protein n=1 Tax=Pseudovibrio ascidiaceicola TaxID=285279 RepID=UPI003D3651AD